MIIYLLLLLPAFANITPYDPPCSPNNPHPIEIWFEETMDTTGGVTVYVRDVFSEAYRKWDDELNRVYNALMKSLDEDGRHKLRLAQRAWLDFRQKELDFIHSGGVYDMGGTLGLLIWDGNHYTILKERTCKLLKYHYLATIYDP